MNKFSKWWIAGAGALVVAGALGVGAVMAQEPSPSPSTTQESTPQAQETPDASTTPNNGSPGAAPDDNDGNGRLGGCGVKGVSPAELAAFLGIDEATLRTELQADGATLATVAAAHGQDRAALIAFLTEQTQSALDERVAAGDLTQAEADEKLAGFTANVDSIVDGSGFGRGFGHGFRGNGDHVPATTPSGT